MQPNNSPKGSLWRKWDLHVHTPYSILNNQFEGDFDNYVKKLFKAAIANNIWAIGITDYFIIDGYKRIVEEYLKVPEKLSSLFSDDEIHKINKIAIFPNLEFRLDKLVVGKEADLKWNRRTNFHVLLSNSLKPDLIQKDFISRIEFEIQAEPGRKPERRSLTKENLEEYGRRLKEQHPGFRDHSSLAVGICNASVDSGEIADLLFSDARLRNNYLLALPCDEDLSTVSWNSAGHGFRKTLVQQSQLIFSSNKNTRNFLLGDYHDSIESFKSEFGLPKACIWGSDAHDFDKLFIPDDNRNTWLKADLTFEGLKQVVFEPKFRVAIQATCPNNKVSYETIESIRFIDNTKKRTFSGLNIHLNPELNSIIGGKSSGKSLLLYHIAKTANPEETERKRKLANASAYTEFFNEKDFDFEVKWANGEVQRLKSPQSQKPITYIPQLYINKLAEESGRSQLNELVLEIIYQNKSIKDEADKLFRERDLVNEKIGTNVTKLVAKRHQYLKAKKELESIGNSHSVQQETQRLNSEIERIKKSSGFTPEENRNYQKISSRLATIERRKTSIESFARNLLELEKNINSEIDAAISNISLLCNPEENKPKDKSVATQLVEKVRGDLYITKQEVIERVKRDHGRAEEILDSLTSSEANTSYALAQFSKKIKSQEELKTLQESLKKEEAKLQHILEADKTVRSINSQGKEIGEQLRNQYSELFSIYLKIENLFNEATETKNELIKLEATLDFNLEHFDSFIDCFDGRGSLSSLLGDSINNNNIYVYKKETHLISIFSIEENIRDFSKIAPKVKKSADEESILRNLLQDCFFISFNLLYKGDDIVSMSPGKRGLVLLNLILHLSNSSHPILIDQPEDNLDNRTVYNELRDFIREKKEDRQIIMVTHNANMVVSTDSECVIVANQSGQQNDKDNEEFKFEYITGAMECTFLNPTATSLLKKHGIREHICEILEGGQLAFEERERKYAFRS